MYWQGFGECQPGMPYWAQETAVETLFFFFFKVNIYFLLPTQYAIFPSSVQEDVFVDTPP